MQKKTLIAYFSRTGENYSRGRMVDLEIGNTKVIAKFIAEITSGDLFEIKPENAYPHNYYDCTVVAKNEIKSKARPKLKQNIDISPYDIIYIGYPIWWYTMPMPVFTFLESHDFNNKVIIPFCTHEGTGLGNSIRDIEQLCPGAKIHFPNAFFGSDVSSAKHLVVRWHEAMDVDAKTK